MDEDPLAHTFESQEQLLNRLLAAINRHALHGLAPGPEALQAWADGIEAALALVETAQDICIHCGTLPTPEVAAAERASIALGDQIFEEVSKRQAAGSSLSVIAVDSNPSMIARALRQPEFDAMGSPRKRFRVAGAVVISRPRKANACEERD